MAKSQEIKPNMPAAAVTNEIIVEKSPTPAQTAAAEQPKIDELPRFRVSWGQKSDVISARDKSEAWARFCDHMKVWPSPKTGKIEAL